MILKLVASTLLVISTNSLLLEGTTTTTNYKEPLSRLAQIRVDLDGLDAACPLDN